MAVERIPVDFSGSGEGRPPVERQESVEFRERVLEEVGRWRRNLTRAGALALAIYGLSSDGFKDMWNSSFAQKYGMPRLLHEVEGRLDKLDKSADGKNVWDVVGNPKVLFSGNSNAEVQNFVSVPDADGAVCSTNYCCPSQPEIDNFVKSHEKENTPAFLNADEILRQIQDGIRDGKYSEEELKTIHKIFGDKFELKSKDSGDSGSGNQMKVEGASETPPQPSPFIG